MSRTAILHIGPMKTGSTSIQWWLSLNRAHLLKRGIFIPTSFRGNNMSRFAHMAEAVAEGRAMAPDDAGKFETLKAELANLPREVSSVIITGEMMAQRLRRVEQVAVVKRLLAPYFDDFRIIIYLRRQDEQALSLYSTALRMGDRLQPLQSAPFNYETVLHAWSAVFGRAAIVPRIFERASMPDGDIVQDFARLIGADYEGSDARKLRQNTSLRPEAQVFLDEIGSLLRSRFNIALKDLPSHQTIVGLMNRRYSGPGQLPTRAEVIAYYGGVREANERVRAAWFPERATLFSEDFSKYPEVAQPPPPAEGVLGVAMETLAAILVPQPASGAPSAAHAPPAGAQAGARQPPVPGRATNAAGAQDAERGDGRRPTSPGEHADGSSRRRASTPG